MITVRDKETGADLGTITDEQLRFLVDHLEEEFDEDQDYYIQRDVLESLEAAGADADLVAFLARAMGDRDGVEIEWSSE